MDESATESTASGRPRSPRARYIVAAVVLGLGTYGVALIATMPARLIIDMARPSPLIESVAGTIWSGDAALAGGHRLEWQVNPLTSLFNLGLSADWSLIGQGTDLSGQALLWPRVTKLSGVEGIAAWKLVRAFAPAVVADCDLAVRVDIETLVLGMGTQTVSGALRTGQATCVFGGQGTKRIIPALKAVTGPENGDTALRIVEAAEPMRLWAELSLLPDRRLAITVNEPAMTLVSNAGSSGPVMLEFGF